MEVDDSSDNAGDGLNGDETRRQIENNDPSLTKLKIGRTTSTYFPNDVYFPNDGNRESIGAAIGRNTQLKELIVHKFHGQEVEDLVRGLAANRSIKRLRFSECNLYDGAIFIILMPFFTDNHNLECLSINECKFWQECIDTLASALEKFNTLKEFNLRNPYESVTLTTSLIEAIAGHSSLTELSLCGAAFGKNGCVLVAAMLQKEGPKLALLDLMDTGMNDKQAITLANGMRGNNSLKELELGDNCITRTGWLEVFAALGNPSCALEKIGVCNNRINDFVLRMFLVIVLQNNNTLKSLDLSGNIKITSAGWEQLFRYLQSPNCGLEEIDLNSNRFNDELIISLSNVLVNYNALKKLNLYNNHRVTEAGWQALSAVLQDPNSALERLNLDFNVINDDALISFANSLVSNDKLKEFFLRRHITTNVGEAFTRILCNTASIMHTYNSNHTLERLSWEPDESHLPEDLRSLLIINRENTKSQAARLKIIKTHFYGNGIDMQHFIDLELNVLPCAMAWIADDSANDAEGLGFGLLYRFVRTLPTLFERAGGHVQGN